MTRSLVAVVLLSLVSPALAQSTDAAAAPPASSQPASRADAQMLYDANVLTVVHAGPLTLRHGHAESWWVDATRGTDRDVIRFDDFYTTVGRPDLARRWSRRHRLLVGLAIAGGVMFAGGVATVIGAGVALKGDPYTAALVSGAVVGGVGLAGLLVGTVGRPSVNQPEAEALASEYNRKLHRQLGLDAPSTMIVPTVSPHGGGLAVALRF